MLVVDPEARITGIDAVKDIWFTKFLKIEQGCEEDKLDSGIITSLRNYRGVSALKKAALNMLVKMLDSKEIENVREQFLKIDTDGTGMISVQELTNAMKNINVSITQKEIEHIIEEVDY